MIVVERTLAVTAAPDAVLGYLADLAHTRDWDSAVEEATRREPGPVGPGASWHQVRRIFGVAADLVYTLITMAPDHLVLHGRNEGATCIDTVWLRPAGAGTEVTYRVELELHGLAKLAVPILQPEFEKQGTASVAGLTAALNGLAAPLTTEITFPGPVPGPTPTRSREAQA
jgi:hypothetical protein